MPIMRALPEYKTYFKNPVPIDYACAFINVQDKAVLSSCAFTINSLTDAILSEYTCFYPSASSQDITDYLLYFLDFNPWINIISLSDKVEQKFSHLFPFLVSEPVHLAPIEISSIIPCQYSINVEKLKNSLKWVKRPEHIIIPTINIDGNLCSTDGHSRLLAGWLNGVDTCYYYLDKTITKERVCYITMRNWCKERSINTVNDLVHHVVTRANHEEFWIKSCQKLLGEQD
jgi:hypothetical protein